jgi:hypothetical protein
LIIFPGISGAMGDGAVNYSGRGEDFLSPRFGSPFRGMANQKRLILFLGLLKNR